MIFADEIQKKIATALCLDSGRYHLQFTKYGNLKKCF
jgi:hypothetical protein